MAAQELRTADGGDARALEVMALACHELRAPLASIRQAVRLLRNSSPACELGDKVHTLIERQMQQLARLVDDFQEFSQPTNARLEFTLLPQRIDLRSVLTRAAETTRPALEAHEHRLERSWPSTAVWIVADPLRLEQVVVNLLSNAARYSDPGGRIALSMKVEGAEAVVSVRDCGIGIAPHLLPRIFDPFVRGAEGQVRNRPGSGVGLTVARRLVELHGGAVTATSAGAGQGSEFTVRLKRAEQVMS